MAPWTRRRLDHDDDIDELMDGLSSPSTLQVAASYVLDHVDDGGRGIIAINDTVLLEERKETEEILEELHRDPLDEFLAQLEMMQTSGTDATGGTRIAAVDDCKFVANEGIDEAKEILENEDSIEDDNDDFGDFQSASYDREDNIIAETSVQHSVDTTPSIVVSDDDFMLASSSSFADTCDLEQQANDVIGSLKTCKSCETLDTPDLLAQAEAVVRSTLLTPKIETLDTLSELGNDYSTPLRASPQEQARVSPPSAQVRRGIMTEATATTKLSLRLPVEDLSNLEGRFTRRRQLRFQSSEGPSRRLEDWGLPSYYFTSPTTDDALYVLKDMPWELYLDDWNEWDEAITERLCHLDAALEGLQGASLQALTPHQPNLDQANQNIHDAEQSLRLAMLYWERSESAVNQAHTGWHGYQTYREEFQEREDFKVLHVLVGRVELLMKKYERLVYETEHFTATSPSCIEHYQALMEQTEALLNDLNHDDFKNLLCLERAKEGCKTLSTSFQERLLCLLQRLVVRKCRGSQPDCWEEYARIMQLFVMVVGEANTKDAAQCWAETINRSVSFELIRCLAVSLLEPEGAEESVFELDLKGLSQDVNESWGDATRVQNIAHNLVIIRFDLEASKRYLPRVGRTLCKLLANCLFSHWLFSQWHREPKTQGFDNDDSLASIAITILPEQPIHKSILAELQNGRDEMWSKALSILGKCFEEYLNFSPKLSLFQRKKGLLDDSQWRLDFVDLLECTLLTERLISLRKQNLLAALPVGERDPSEINVIGRMAGLVRSHLRVVHVEAMNSVGRKLSKENWSLTTFPHQCEPETTGKPIGDVYMLIQTALEAAYPFPSNSLQREIEQRWKMRNPSSSSKFAEVFDHPCTDETFIHPIRPFANGAANGTTVEDFLDTIVQSCDDEPRLASSALCDEVLPWFGRLSAIMKNLNVVTDDVAAVFANITDLYVTTVFRACAGSKKTERVLLGEHLPNAFVFPKLQVESDENSSSTKASMFDSFRKRPSLLTRKSSSISIPSDLHADLCSPFPNEQANLGPTQAFIFRAQASLEDIVNLDMVDNWLVNPVSGDSIEERACSGAKILVKRETAILSSVVLAYVLAVTVDNTVGSDDGLKAFQSYARSLIRVTLPLANIAREISAVHALNCDNVVKDILAVGDGWEESKLHENANEYIEDLSDLCSLVWGYLNASGKIPRVLQERTWNTLLKMVFTTLADGFSRIANCSTEGRALMALDTAYLSANLSPQRVQERCGNTVVADLPPRPDNSFNRSHLDSYVRAFYLPVPDAMAWVSNNYKSFHLNHSIALIVNIALSSQDPNHCRESALRQLVEDVKRIYREQVE